MPLGRPDGPIVILGDPSTVFVQHPAKYWRRQGIETVIVSGRTTEPLARLEDGTPVIAAERRPTPLGDREWSILGPILGGVEDQLSTIEPERRRAVSNAWGPEKNVPSLAAAVRAGLVVSEVVRDLRPRAVLGQEAFWYGLATALSYGAPRTLVVWGGDVQLFAETSLLHHAMCRFALQSVESVAVCAAPIGTRVIEAFGVTEARVHPISFGVDTTLFAPRRGEARDRLRASLGLPQEALVITSVRRFDPLWGCQVVLEACLRAAEQSESAHFVFIGGAGNHERIEAARREVDGRGLASRFSYFEGNLQMAEFARLICATDVAISASGYTEPKSWSVLQAMAAGAAVVVGDQPAYREVAAAGADLALVDGSSPDAIADAVGALVRDVDRRQAMVSANINYIRDHEDERQQMARLLRIVEHGQFSRTASASA